MRIGIVCSEYHAEYTNALLDGALGGLAGHEPAVVRVPGAFEIPLALQRMAESGRFGALIALGLIWQGETDHADLIARETARACVDICLDHDIPVVFEVLTVRTAAQARARCMGKRLNRGAEAAATALRMAALDVNQAAGPSTPPPRRARRLRA